MERWASPGLAAQAAYLRHLGTAPVAQVMDRDGVYAVRTGIASNTENGVLSSGDVPDALVAETIEWLGHVPASWLCAEASGREATGERLVAARCRPDQDAWEMRRAVGDPVGTFPAGVSIAPVTSAVELDGWLDVAGASGWFENAADRRAKRALYRSLGHAPSTHSLYVAWRKRRPVGMASAFFTDDLVLLDALAVVDDEQRRGIGRALALARLREARDRGCVTAVLAPSPDGAKLYTSLGFESHRQPEDRWFYLPDR